MVGGVTTVSRVVVSIAAAWDERGTFVGVLAVLGGMARPYRSLRASLREKDEREREEGELGSSMECLPDAAG